MDSAADADSDASVSLSQVAWIAAVGDVAAFTAIGWILFEDAVFGLAIGVLVGAGIGLFLHWMDAPEADVEGPTPARGGRNLGAAGAALTTGGIVAFALRFALPGEPLLALAAGVVLAAIEYVVLSQVLPARTAAEAG